MAHAPLYAKLDFEALSYTWVGRNLLSALRALRYTDRPRYLWIDALCINQDDDKEKSREVQRMRHIYEQAANVVLWLGEAADGSDDAMDLAASQTLGNVLQGTDQHWSALTSLVRRAWWKRIWCLQELVSSRWSPIVMCGTKTVSWLKMSDTHAAIRGQYTSGVKLRIFYLLYITVAWEATDARDKIFGLVGLCDPEDRAALVPDYSLSARQVYEMTARHLMKESLNCLCLNAGSTRTEIFDGPLPSWIPDWSSAQSPPLWKPGCYQASCTASNVRQRPAMIESEDANAVRIAGGFLDYISDISNVVFADDAWSKELPTGLYHTIRSIESFMRNAMRANHPEQNPERYIDPEQSDMVWRTLISDTEAWDDAKGSFTSISAGSCLDGAHADEATPGNPEQLDEVVIRHIPRYISLLSHALHKRRLFITKRGFFGLSSQHIAPGDIVAILVGGDMPFVLRESQKSPKSPEPLRIISEAYVYGAMNGKLFRVLPKMIFTIG
ncbi:heterokaryon incompatibility protein [Hirsutella rhossiliensis]|uniref:Heterokaryon incompatibility protein (HET) domain-containing protein n=1 Tax=Hirsutella rhossiliensis TaxID=111463 RepID=A0A9P8MVA8_9HYPO|nr:heterokaryon incompatibility protein (HET) domain-containing protein [Hirsutella rhossiliensis]KAH0961079.1 heterokaryon incompatibility protein (HET) domain-containing protein [Hirsutella rhossiliensis]